MKRRIDLAAAPPRTVLFAPPAALGAGSLRVILSLKVGFRPEAELDDRDAAEQRRTIAALQERLIAELANTDAEALRRYKRLPLLGLKVDEPALRHLLASPVVQWIRADEPEPPARGLSRIRATSRAARGRPLPARAGKV